MSGFRLRQARLRDRNHGQPARRTVPDTSARHVPHPQDFFAYASGYDVFFGKDFYRLISKPRLNPFTINASFLLLLSRMPISGSE